VIGAGPPGRFTTVVWRVSIARKPMLPLQPSPPKSTMPYTAAVFSATSNSFIQLWRST